MRAYEIIVKKFCAYFGDSDLKILTADHLLGFMIHITEGRKPQTKHNRISHLSAFFNFVHNNLDPQIKNPCQSPMLRKAFRSKVSINWDIPEKDTIDEIIFRTTNIRDRLMLELMARAGMRLIWCRISMVNSGGSGNRFMSLLSDQ